MSKFIPDGVVKLVICDDLDDPAAPTAAEIEAGVDLTAYWRPGGDQSPVEGSTADAATADSTFNKTVRGTRGGQDWTAVFTRDSVWENNLAWRTLPVGTQAFAVVRLGPSVDEEDPGAAIDDGDRVTVTQIDVHTRKPTVYGARNETATFEVRAAVNEDPWEDVVVGGGS